MKDMTREKELASAITDALNPFGFKRKAFCEAMSREHRALQSEWMELVCEFIRYAASDAYGVDGRNEWVKTVCKKLEKELP